MNIQIITLGPMRVASIYAFGTDPRQESWQKLVDWAGPKGLLARKSEFPVFGFNNPGRRPGSLKYGYELWIKIGPEIEQEGNIRIVEFNGGSYAVTRYKSARETDNALVAWGNLIRWCKENRYRPGSHQALEKFVTRVYNTEDFILDLYYPIAY